MIFYGTKTELLKARHRISNQGYISHCYHVNPFAGLPNCHISTTLTNGEHIEHELERIRAISYEIIWSCSQSATVSMPHFHFS